MDKTYTDHDPGATSLHFNNEEKSSDAEVDEWMNIINVEHEGSESVNRPCCPNIISLSNDITMDVPTLEVQKNNVVEVGESSIGSTGEGNKNYIVKDQISNILPLGDLTFSSKYAEIYRETTMDGRMSQLVGPQTRRGHRKDADESTNHNRRNEGSHVIVDDSSKINGCNGAFGLII